MAYWILIAFLVGLVLGFTLAVFITCDSIKDWSLKLLQWMWPCFLLLAVIGFYVMYKLNVLNYMIDK
jgi:hypothetical protein